MNKDIIMREVNLMRYFWAIFWTFLLMQMLTYVVGSMIGVAFDVNTGTILAVVSVIVIFAISAVLPKNDPTGDKTIY
jgi:hypothetical protein